VARYRKTAVAALAASALLLTPTAAYADHNHRGVSASSERSMSWGYYSGPLTDLSTATPDAFDGARATAIMISVGPASYFRVQVRGIDKDATNSEGYGSHLHVGPCMEADKGPVGAHYNISTDVPPLVNDETEVWLDFKANSDGNAGPTSDVRFVPDEGERSIVIHESPTDKYGKAGAKLACLPFKIKATS
jgi:hypothetical protein